MRLELRLAARLGAAREGLAASTSAAAAFAAFAATIAAATIASAAAFAASAVGAVAAADIFEREGCLCRFDELQHMHAHLVLGLALGSGLG